MYVVQNGKVVLKNTLQMCCTLIAVTYCITFLRFNLHLSLPPSLSLLVLEGV